MTTHTDTIGAIYQAFGSGDVPFILDHMAENVSWDEGIRATDVPYLQPGTGKDHVARFFETLGATIEFTTFEPQAMCASDDTVMVTIKEAGRNLVTGAPLAEETVAHVFTFGDDGRIVAFRHIGDFAVHEAAMTASAAALS
jgi:ketosteroid isomerase-like protein